MKIFVKKIVRKISIIIIKLIYDIWSWMVYFFRPEKDDLLSEFCLDDRGGVYFICAIWQKKLCPNFFSALEVLSGREVNVLVINNSRMNSSDINKILDLRVKYIERTPGNGRDIAAYKLGVNIIYKNFANRRELISRVVFMNDSILVVASRFSRFLDLIDYHAKREEVIGVTETEQFHYHISSWFFSVSSDVFFSRDFIRFWKKYTPLQNRRHSIRRGEVALTGIYKKIGISPHIVFNNNLILEKIDEIGAANFMPLLRPIVFDYYLKFRSEISKNFLTSEEILSAQKIFLTKMTKDDNQTSFWNIFLLKHMDFPFIKKDLYVHERYDLTQFRRILDDMLNSGDLNQSDYNFMKSVILGKMQVSESGLLKRLKYAASVI